MAYSFSFTNEKMDTNSEEGKVYWVVMNTALNGLSIDDYNWLEEAKLWSKSKDYFPYLSWEEFLNLARKYEFWNSFEEVLKKYV